MCLFVNSQSLWSYIWSAPVSEHLLLLSLVPLLIPLDVQPPPLHLLRLLEAILLLEVLAVRLRL